MVDTSFLPGHGDIPALRKPFFYGPVGIPNEVVPCIASTDESTITLTPPNQFNSWYNKELIDQQVFGFFADADPEAGDLEITVGNLGLYPVFSGGEAASETSVEIGDYCQVCFDSALGDTGGFVLLNWTRLTGGSTAGSVQFVSAAGPVTVLASTRYLVITKTAMSDTPVDVGPINMRSGLALTVSDFSGMGQEITLTADAGDTGGIMGQPTAIIRSSGVGVGLAAALTITPNEDLEGWFQNA